MREQTRPALPHKMSDDEHVAAKIELLTAITDNTSEQMSALSVQLRTIHNDVVRRHRQMDDWRMAAHMETARLRADVHELRAHLRALRERTP